MKSKQGNSSPGYLDADRPIEHRGQDRLGRRDLAQAIARQIRKVPAENGFTIAVAGEWGSGKTSLLNMVVEVLTDNDHSATVLHFNPWLFRGAADLVPRFFSELSAQLRLKNNQRLKEVASAFSQLGEVLAPLSPVPGTGVAARILSVLTKSTKERQSLFAQRDHLRKALEKSTSRVVVLVDDIDRLEPHETREVMRLIRLTSDLPNVVFLLAYDRRQVAKSLSTNSEDTEGQGYLDKIIQISYDLPAIREPVLADVFFHWLNDVIQAYPVPQLDRDVWGRVFYGIVKPLLGNLRDVKRYMYSLPVTLEAVGQEVALADLLGLEALRILRPSLFEELRARPEFLVHSHSPTKALKSSAEQQNETKEGLSTILVDAGTDRQVMESVLEILFPVTQGLLNNFGMARNPTALGGRRGVWLVRKCF